MNAILMSRMSSVMRPDQRGGLSAMNSSTLSAKDFRGARGAGTNSGFTSAAQMIPRTIKAITSAITGARLKIGAVGGAPYQ